MPTDDAAPGAIRLVDLRKTFSGAAAVDGVDLAVEPGSFLVLLGPSGCGKTTILRMLAGLETPTGGEIHMSGKTVASGGAGMVVAAGRRDAGLVFQSYALWPHMTVRGNVEWPLRVARWDRAKRATRSDEVLALLGVSDYADRYPGELSGGQQQRVAIARMIAPRPSILLFDEPLSNLDAKLRVEMRTELLRVHRATGATSVYVTHDQVEAMTMATHVAVLRSGRVEQFGGPRELLDSPATPFVATFIGTPPANLVPVVRRGGHFRAGAADFGPAPDHTEGDEALLLYRAEALALADAPGPRRLEGTFAEVTPIAGRASVTVWVDDRRVHVVCDRLPEARVGDRVWVQFPEAPERAFGAAQSPADPPLVRT